MAEAWGASRAINLALEYSRGADFNPRLACILVAGDNPNIARYCSSRGRRDSADVHAVLDGPLAVAASSGRRFEWVLVPRGLNPDAHDAAKAAALHAVCVAASGATAHVHCTV